MTAQIPHLPDTSDERIRSWLFDVAFPFWADLGVDKLGPAFIEHLREDGGEADVGFKRVRVQARQVYCFCQAAELGWNHRPLETAEPAVELLLRQAWKGPNAGWISTLSRAGGDFDTTPDLYDIAFALFGLAWWYRVTQDKRVLEVALQTLDFLHNVMRHPSGRGYLHRVGGTAPFFQNPHMHLTEAMIVWRDATGDARFAEEADSLVRLCLGHFYDERTGTLAEDFDRDWRRIAENGSIRIEPGHLYEWIWLLQQYMDGHEVPRDDVAAVMRRMFDFAIAHGQNPKNDLVVDAVDPHGRVTLPDHRLWPQAERMKATLVMSEAAEPELSRVITGQVDRFFSLYLDVMPAGTWIEHRTPDLKPRGGIIRASSFYHIVLAFAEILKSKVLLPSSPAAPQK